jgi:hypothetical protein
LIRIVIVGCARPWSAASSVIRREGGWNVDLRGSIRQSRLDQRHRNARVFGQPGGQHASRTARADHYVVVHVDSFLPVGHHRCQRPLPNDQRRQLMLRKGRDYRPSNI